MNTTILLASLILAVLDWIAVGLNLRRLEYLLKPAVMIFVLIYLGKQGGFSSPLIWFIVGAALSLIGDIFLMLPNEKFIAGMISFGVAYLSYGIGFLYQTNLNNFALVGLVLFILLPGLEIYKQVSKALVRQNLQNLKAPFFIYAIILSFLLATACSTLTGQDWAAFPAFLVSIGALLIYLSDIFLAWNKFVHGLPGGRLINMITYTWGKS